MPGEHCSDYGCGTCRGRAKYKGISIFQIPKKIDGNAEQNKWRSEFLGKITATRVVDADFRKQIESDHVYACEKHFTPDDYNICKYILRRFC